jgi:ACS family sodium-dependent inorganic phosphate cotransporter
MADEFGWDKAYAGTVLSSFFAGYGATQVWGGRLADRYGGSAVLAAGLVAWSACAALTPLAAAHSPEALLAARAGLGMAQGVAFPAIHALLAKGVPDGRRSGSIGTVLALAHCGTAMAFGLSPTLIELGGWESSFYAFAGMGALWALPWWRMHRGLKASICAAKEEASAAQQRLLLPLQPQQQERQLQRQQSARAEAAADPKVGLWPLLRRKEVWAIVVAQYCASYGFFGLLAWLPSFFLEHCGLQLSEVGPGRGCAASRGAVARLATF